MKEYMKVLVVGEVISGTSDNGNDWEKQQIVFEKTSGTKPRTLAVDFMGEKKTRTTKKLKPGMLCEVTYEPDSHQYGDRWFTNLEGISVTPLQAVAPETLPDAEPAPPAPAA